MDARVFLYTPPEYIYEADLFAAEIIFLVVKVIGHIVFFYLLSLR